MNNPSSVKLEVFNLVLKPVDGHNKNSFEDFFEKMSNPELSDSFFIQFVQRFVTSVETEYKQIRNKAFTLTTEKDGWGHDEVNNCIWGVLKGGLKGTGKTKSPIINRTEEEDLDGNVINNKFFFYIHLPHNESRGFVFFQSYSGENIRNEFLQHLNSIFKIPFYYNVSTSNPILPNSIRDEFKENSKIVEMHYNTKILTSSITDEPSIVNACENLKIEISIKPAGSNDLDMKKIGLLNRVLSKLSFNTHEIGESETKKVSLQNKSSKKMSTFKLEVGDVMPKIYLLNRVDIDKFGIPNFIELKIFCDELLNELVDDQYERIVRK